MQKKGQRHQLEDVAYTFVPACTQVQHGTGVSDFEETQNISKPSQISIYRRDPAISLSKVALEMLRPACDCTFSYTQCLCCKKPYKKSENQESKSGHAATKCFSCLHIQGRPLVIFIQKSKRRSRKMTPGHVACVLLKKEETAILRLVVTETHSATLYCFACS